MAIHQSCQSKGKKAELGPLRGSSSPWQHFELARAEPN